jgi:hypothetical protein
MWLQAPIDVEGSHWLSDIGVLSPDRQWTYAANTSAAEQIANRALLDAIAAASHHENSEAETAAIIQIAQKVLATRTQWANMTKKGIIA